MPANFDLFQDYHAYMCTPMSFTGSVLAVLSSVCFAQDEGAGGAAMWPALQGRDKGCGGAVKPL